jgi:acetoin utilization deacetylase AcuC-like enzyme
MANPIHPLLVFTHDDCLRHEPGYPERPDRIGAVRKGLDQLDEVVLHDAAEVSHEQLARVHATSFLDQLGEIERGIENGSGPVALAPDTQAGEGSFRAARLAAGAACQAVRSVIDAREQSAFAAVRPPGHHAETRRAMGFCLYNSIAVAAAEALADPAIRRVAVCDFDVHHGNGTEEIFAGRRDVLFASSHQLPLYPGTGDPDQRVAANVHNAALPPGSGSDEFRNAWKAHLFDPIDRFAPDLILVSAGFDAHWRDPLAHLHLKDEDFYWIGHQLRVLARTHASGRLAASLEGGYDLHALTESALAFAEGITSAH